MAVEFASNTLTFGSQYYGAHCQDTHIPVQGVTEKLPEQFYALVTEVLEPKIRPQRPYQWNIIILNGTSFFWTVTKWKLTILRHHCTTSIWQLTQRIQRNNPRRKLFPISTTSLYHCAVKFWQIDLPLIDQELTMRSTWKKATHEFGDHCTRCQWLSWLSVRNGGKRICQENSSENNHHDLQHPFCFERQLIVDSDFALSIGIYIVKLLNISIPFCEYNK